MAKAFAYYNDTDPFCVEWLSHLMSDGLIPLGLIDNRSIEDVAPEDLDGFTQCHFFAGIGGWSHALRLAGWPDDRPCWTGSCPCQPYSAAGQGKGFADERHLWPAFYHLISECRPVVLFGEQVTAAIGHGWLDLVQADMEGAGYAFWAHGLAACSVEAPHQRKRLYFVGESGSPFVPTRSAEHGNLDQPSSQGLAQRSGRALSPRLPRSLVERSSDYNYWRTCDWLPCQDGRSRPTQPGLFPLASGVPNRVGTLRGAGNSIVPQCGQAFIEAYMSARS